MIPVPQALDAAWQHYRRGEWPQAERLYRQIVETDPTQVDALHLLAAIAGQTGRYELATDCLRAVLRLRPDWAAAHNNLGNVCAAQRRLAEAVACFEEAIRLQPDFASAHSNLGNALRELGRPADAVASLQQALRLRPDDTEAHHSLGLAWLALGRPRDAQAAFQEAVRLRPDHADAHYQLGHTLLEEGRAAEAAAHFEQTLRIKGDHAGALHSLGLPLGPSQPATTGNSADRLRCLYLDLIESCLLNLIYEDPWTDWSERSQPRRFDSERRRLGRDWPVIAHTMIGQLRMRNIRDLVEAALRDHVPGDLIETGVWRGGACIYMRAILQAHGVRDRRVFVADSFAGLPPPSPEKYPADTGDPHHRFTELAVSLDQVKQNFSKYGLLDDQVVFLKGWFKDTLPAAPIERLAVLRLDGDMYESTMDSLNSLYHKVSPGGYVIVDDYGCIASCRAAVHDFRAAHGITAPIINIDGMGVYWQKPFGPDPRSRTLSPTQVRSDPGVETGSSAPYKVNIANFVLSMHTAIFDELIDLLADAFRRLRVDTTGSQNRLHKDRLNVIVGQTCCLPATALAGITNSGCPYVVFQMEVLDERAGFARTYPHYIEFLRRAGSIWDYSETNKRYLESIGCERVTCIPIGYSTVLERIPPSGPEDRDIDILFYGSMSERRARVLQALEDSGLKVERLFGVYGQSRDHWIARTKVVLNVHHFEAPQLEQIRLAYLLNNQRFVISEASDSDPYGGGVVFAAYEDIVDCCKRYLAPGMEAERDRVAQLGYAQLKSLPMLERLQSALEQDAAVRAQGRIIP